MTTAGNPRPASLLIRAACALVAATAISTLAQSASAATLPSPRAEGWLVKSYEQIAVPAAPKNKQGDIAALKAMVAKRSAEDVSRFHWWAAGGPAYRWNEIILTETQEGFVTVPLALRHLALFHAALDDAIALARHHSKSRTRGEPATVDAAIKTSDATASMVSERRRRQPMCSAISFLRGPRISPPRLRKLYSRVCSRAPSCRTRSLRDA
jgi:hypothetical protein